MIFSLLGNVAMALGWQTPNLYGCSAILINVSKGTGV